jgi:hypothetical protein
MTTISARVLAVGRRGDQYRIVVRIGPPKYQGSFNTLVFGEHKPRIGSYHNGRLDLIYFGYPDIKVGQPFRLWTIQ